MKLTKNYLISKLSFFLRYCKGALIILALKIGFLVAFVLRLFIFRAAVLHFKGRSVFCSGAAPSAKKPKKNYDRYVAVSHASKLLVDIFGVECDLNIIIDINERREYAKNVRQLLVTGTKQVRRKCQKNAFINYKNFFGVHPGLRAFIINYVCNTNYLDNIPTTRFTNVGSGAWTLAFLVFLGVKSVHITGINLRTGTNSAHHTTYFDGFVSDEAEKKIDYNHSSFRNHSSPDLNVFSSIALIYRDRVKITTDEPEFKAAIFPNLS
jgi:hypothetical protein